MAVSSQRFYSPAGVAAREVPRRPLLGRAHRDPRELRGGGGPHAVLRRQEEELDLPPAVHANLQSGPPRGPTFCPHPLFSCPDCYGSVYH